MEVKNMKNKFICNRVTNQLVFHIFDFNVQVEPSAFCLAGNLSEYIQSDSTAFSSVIQHFSYLKNLNWEVLSCPTNQLWDFSLL